MYKLAYCWTLKPPYIVKGTQPILVSIYLQFRYKKGVQEGKMEALVFSIEKPIQQRRKKGSLKDVNYILNAITRPRV